jgi:hypothetical protein
MTPQSFVKQKYPNAKNMYREGGGHAIMFFDGNKTVVLAYGSTPAKAWKNAKESIEKQATNSKP